MHELSRPRVGLVQVCGWVGERRVGGEASE